jgi:hypothetical protein
MHSRGEPVHTAAQLLAHIEPQPYLVLQAQRAASTDADGLCSHRIVSERELMDRTYGGRNLQCSFLISGWHGWCRFVNPSDELCAKAWTKARAHLTFVGLTYDMQRAFSTLARLTGVPAIAIAHENRVKENSAQVGVTLQRNDLNAVQLARINATQQGDWAMFANVPFGLDAS